MKTVAFTAADVNAQAILRYRPGQNGFGKKYLFRRVIVCWSVLMRIIISVFFLLFLCFSAAGQAKPAAVISYDTAFKPAEFTDPARLEKIKQTFPAIEKRV